MSALSSLPSGTVTFLFTDIEGSTRLLKQLRGGYRQLLTDHQRILRECFEAHGGREIDTQGDSFFVAFARAGDAVASAIDAQQALATHAWPEGVDVRVRMGLHSGEPRASGERYVGVGVHRAARVGAAGHGGQILVSNATRELVEDELPPDTTLRDLGVYRLKDVDRPERLFQVETVELQREFPPLAAPRVDERRGTNRLVVALGALLAVVILAASIAAAYTFISEGPAVGSAERPMRIVTTWNPGEPEHKAFTEVLRTFQETTGYTAVFQPLLSPEETDFSVAMERQLRQQNPPAVVITPSPGFVRGLARDGIAKPLSALGVTDNHLRETYGPAWPQLTTYREEAYGFPLKATSKSLLWYQPDQFRRLRLRAPTSWAGLVSVTAEIKRQGEVPWSVSASDSWTLTDWFENLYIGTAGPWKYDALFAGKLPFDDSSVLTALRLMTNMLSEENVSGGIDGALDTDLGESIGAVLGPKPRAHLYLEGGFIGPIAHQLITPMPRPGKTIAAAPFPSIDASLGSQVVVGADFVIALADDEAVRALLRYLSAPGAGRIWVSSGVIVSPHRGVPLSAYPNLLVRTEARQITTAKIVRLDGSDLLPGSLGSDLGTTLQRVLQQPEQGSPLMQAFQEKAAKVFQQ